MYLKTAAIVLHRLPYGDRSSIISFYTAEKGRIDCMVYSTKGSKSGIKRALLEPLSVVELELELIHGRELHRIIEIKSKLTITFLGSHPVKNVLAFFIAECLYRIFKESQTDITLYDFIEQSIITLNFKNDGFANFHLVFLLQLTRFLGFYPNLNKSFPVAYFDMVNGIFVPTKPQHASFLNPDDSLIFQKLMRMNYSNMHLFGFSRHERVLILEQILHYYRIHIPTFGTIHSLGVFSELFDA
ncbi:DNA repair protein RecO [Microbacter margulisiae]|uniref:DNA repair protein RecO n=1 Tax=Microbacter margulisiae TaxID=1350067 RepID=A0A7W5DR75_9PORP|nr:DNA repair protein RecO [Microbacter margulisiae]MBB3187044.1 DNA repair protein RecO (recombination protein O) [Microbacter margulisiae]